MSEESSSYSFEFQRRVEFHETDLAGIVHFSNFFRYMEDCEHAFYRSLGYSVHEMDDGEGGSVLWPAASELMPTTCTSFSTA